MEKPAVVTSSPGPSHWGAKRNVLIDAVIIALVLTAIGLSWYFGHRPKSEPASKVPQYSEQQLANEVNKRTGQNNYVGAIELIKGQKTINESAVQLLLAAAYANNKEYSKALDIYDSLEVRHKLNEINTATAAEVAERAGKYQKAIDLYKKAKKRGDSANTDQQAVYNFKISELEKKL